MSTENFLLLALSQKGITYNEDSAFLDLKLNKVHGPKNHALRELPQFVRQNHPRFVEFIEAYYEWLEQPGNPYYSIDKMRNFSDIDESVAIFIQEFRKQYLDSFPIELAISEDGNPINQRTLMKNIKNFYAAKGTERAYKLLLRVLLNTPVEVYYPKKDVLKASDGKWIEEKSIRVTTGNGTENFRMLGRTVTQTDPITGEYRGSARISRVLQFTVEQYDITELFLEDIQGTFSPGKTIQCVTAAGDTLSETVLFILGEISVSSGGRNYRIGDTVDFTGSDGIKMQGTVASTTPKGSVKAVKITDPGINFSRSGNFKLKSPTGDGNGVVLATPSGIINYDGYYENNDGKSSSNKRMFDGDFYQDHSYALKCEATLNDYRQAVKDLIHPAGLKLFGYVSFIRGLANDIDKHSEFQRYEIPVIGHYTPYRTKTTANLKTKYLNGFNPGSCGAGSNDLRIYAVGPSGLTQGFIDGLPDGVFFKNASNLATILDGSWVTFGVSSGNNFVFYIDRLSGNSYAIGDSIGFVDGVAGFTLTGTADGLGFIKESDGSTHDPQGAPLGTGGSDGASLWGLTAFWNIYHHPNTRGIIGIDGSTGGTGAGISFGPIVLRKFFRMPFGYHYHSNPGTAGDPYFGVTGDNYEYSTALGGGLTSPNF